jgi:hypothetical protein
MWNWSPDCSSSWPFALLTCLRSFPDSTGTGSWSPQVDMLVWRLLFRPIWKIVEKISINFLKNMWNIKPCFIWLSRKNFLFLGKYFSYFEKHGPVYLETSSKSPKQLL